MVSVEDEKPLEEYLDVIEEHESLMKRKQSSDLRSLILCDENEHIQSHPIIHKRNHTKGLEEMSKQQSLHNMTVLSTKQNTDLMGSSAHSPSEARLRDVINNPTTTLNRSMSGSFNTTTFK